MSKTDEEKIFILTLEGFDRIMQELERRADIAAKKGCASSWRDLAMFSEAILLVFSQIDDEIFNDLSHWQLTIEANLKNSMLELTR